MKPLLIAFSGLVLLVFFACEKEAPAPPSSPQVPNPPGPTVETSLAPLVGTWARRATYCEHVDFEQSLPILFEGFLVNSDETTANLNFLQFDTTPMTITRRDDTLFFSPPYLDSIAVATWRFDSTVLLIEYRSVCFGDSSIIADKHWRQ